MPARLQRARFVLPRVLLVLAVAAGISAAVALAGVAALRWAHHVAALAEVAAGAVAALLAAAVVARRLAGDGVGKNTILELDLTHPLPEADPAGALPRPGGPGGGRPTLREAVEAVERAGADPRVVALFARLGGPPGGLGRIQEIRDAVAAFRATGKPAVAFSETFGEFSPGTGAYYLATAFDQIVLQPSGDVNLTGLMAAATFVRGALDKLGVAARLDHRREYKTAMNLLTETGFTPAHRESLGQLVRSQFDQIVRGVAEGRNVPEAAVAGLVDRGPFLGPDALEAGLVDRLAYRDQVIADLEERAGAGAQVLPLARYARLTRPGRRRGDRVALIMGVGGIRRGRSGGPNPLDRGRPSMGSDTVSAAFRAAIDDRRVKAILFRVDSPGGSYVASDVIWRQVVRAREAGKPVIVSMGDVAGSGGYFVAAAADKIVAQPGTITGSIGVFAGKAVTAGLRAKLGLSTDEVHAGSQATMWSDALDYTPAGWEKLQAFLDRAYEDFTTKVATGRGLDPDAMPGVAEGRVWTGAQAKELGLVDQLGGYRTALALVRQAIGRPEGAPLRLEVFPRRRSLLDLLRPGRGRSGDEAAATLPLLGDASPLAGRLGLGEAATLAMPPFELDL